MAKVHKTEKWTFSLTLLVAIAGATLLGGFYGNRLFGAPMQNSEVQKRLREYTDLLNAVTAHSPEDIGSDKFVYASIDGMLRNLDPHTSFLEPKEYSDMQDRQKGTFYGLGILVTKRNDQVTVITPLEGTPAARLGIRAGDVLVLPRCRRDADDRCVVDRRHESIDGGDVHHLRCKRRRARPRDEEPADGRQRVEHARHVRVQGRLESRRAVALAGAGQCRRCGCDPRALTSSCDGVVRPGARALGYCTWHLHVSARTCEQTARETMRDSSQVDDRVSGPVR
jgi:hypothetical protein